MRTIKLLLKENRKILLILLIALVFRLVLLPLRNHDDLFSNAAWGEKIYMQGTKDFYENEKWIYSWPSQLPLMNLTYVFDFVIFAKLLTAFTKVAQLLSNNNFLPGIFSHWFNFVDWFGWKYYLETPFFNGFLISIKILPVVCDLAIAAFLYSFGKKVTKKETAILITLLYLFLPFSWYVSSLWGQYDQISAFLLVLAFVFLQKKRGAIGGLMHIASPVFFFLATQIKPHTFFVAPLYVFLYLKKKPSFISFLYSLLIVGGIFIYTLNEFSDRNLWVYFYKIVLPRVFISERMVIATHSFNFWQTLYPIKAESTHTFLFGISNFVWGNIFILSINIAGIYLALKKKFNLEGIISGAYVVSAGYYIFGTGMLDRYYFPGMLFFTVLILFNKYLLRLWLAASVLFSLNLVLSWGYPFITYTNNVIWNQEYLVSVLSFLQTAIFISSLFVLYDIKVKAFKIERVRKAI